VVGQLQAEPTPDRIKDMAENTAEVIRHPGFRAVDAVGHSDDANVAFRLARSDPELVRRVVAGSADLPAGLSPAELQVRQRWSEEP
jgi:pimeloyl-ACP methyl ester carboxylesterase